MQRYQTLHLSLLPIKMVRGLWAQTRWGEAYYYTHKSFPNFRRRLQSKYPGPLETHPPTITTQFRRVKTILRIVRTSGLLRGHSVLALGLLIHALQKQIHTSPSLCTVHGLVSYNSSKDESWYAKSQRENVH